MSESVEDGSLTLDSSLEDAFVRIEQAADEWGAEYEREGNRARLVLPVRAGLRQGFVEAEVLVEEISGGARLTLVKRGEQWRLQGSAVVVLLASAAGGVVASLWPFFPELIPLAPFGAILALSGWFLVISRLRTSRATDFLRTVELLAAKSGGNAH